MSLGPIILY